LNLTSSANSNIFLGQVNGVPGAHTDGRCQQGQKKQLNPCHGKAEQTLRDKNFSISTYIAICSDIIYDPEGVTCPIRCWAFQQYCFIVILPFLQAVVISWWLLKEKKGRSFGIRQHSFLLSDTESVKNLSLCPMNKFDKFI
jgi:hypothetical protein